MKKRYPYGIFFFGLLVMINIACVASAGSDSEDMKATKLNVDKYTGESSKSFNDLIEEQKKADKEYRDQMMANSEKTVQLLERILIQLVELNEKKSK